ncbi:TlpA disulfide reductase family protein [Massilia sp. METH4]|uniref:TlpA disulfide reductase family protein n=1 Tax=Massilia sp. METH4 TaxID=3123041 RepID=UPI0030CF216A
MNITLGPLVFNAVHLLFALSFLVALAIGHWHGRRKGVNAAGVLADMLLVCLVVARLAFVAAWFDQYAREPLSILDIRDQGFMMWPGLVGAALYGAWRVTRKRALAEPLAASVIAGSLAWFMSGASSVATMGEQQAVPAVALTAMDGSAATLAQVAARKPLVVNLWATWCPPCRHEMPVLAQAQRDHPEVAFVFVNQGEAAGTVAAYLGRAGLQLDHSLLDQPKALGQSVGSLALPTTFFYDERGRLADTHIGMLSAATLRAKLAAIEGKN